MSTSLIIRPEELKSIEVIAKAAADSKHFEKLGGYAGILCISLYANEMGIPVMSALYGGVSNIMGKITMAPQMMNAKIRQAGHKMEIQSSDTQCTIKGLRNDTGESCTVSFSIEDAKRAGIFKSGGGWDKYPSDMCFARALSRLARRLFPDVIGMAYVEGEIEDDSKQKTEQKIQSFTQSQQTIDIPSEKSDAKTMYEFNMAFKHLQDEDGQLMQYLDGICEQRKITPTDAANKAMAEPNRFGEVFSKWVEKKKSKASKITPEVAESYDVILTEAQETNAEA